MKIPATFAALCIAASAALTPAPGAIAAPLAGPLSLSEAATAPIVQVRYKRHAYRAYGYRYTRAFGRGGCVSGTPDETSAYPSWQVCPHR
jgi:hypothetical protein